MHLTFTFDKEPFMACQAVTYLADYHDTSFGRTYTVLRILCMAMVAMILLWALKLLFF
jgi:hypothetical protein